MPQKVRTRLNTYISSSLGISRRKANELISNGLIVHNGKIANHSSKVSSNDLVFYKNKQLKINKKIYILLNKPVGYVCSRVKQGNAPTIYDLLPKAYHKLKTVGRLDRDSCGLILLTNDGEFAHKLTHPKFSKTKVYRVQLDKSIENRDLINLNIGVDIENYVSIMQVKKITNNLLEVSLRMGKNRQIRKTFAKLNYHVLHLERTNFGRYSQNHLEGKRFIEVQYLR